MKCIICDSLLHGRQRKFCSRECKIKFHSRYENKSAEWKRRSGKRSSKRHRRLRERVGELLGNECSICERTDIRLVAHQMSGKGHNSSGGTTSLKYAIDHPEEMVRLCYACHKGVHWAMKYLNMTWEDIVKIAPVVQR